MEVATVKKMKKKVKKIPVHPQGSSGKFIKKKDRPEEEIIEEMVDMDPRKSAFAAAYLDPMSITFGNGLQSAIKVGFTPQYAKNLLTNRPRWLCEMVDKLGYISSVQKNIKKHLELKTEVPVMTAFGPYIDKKTKKMVMAENSKLLKIQQDMTIFVAERLMPDYRKKDRGEGDIRPVEIKQIIIIAPNGESIDYNKTNTEAISSIPEVA